MRCAHLFFYFFYFVCCFVTAVNKPLKFHVAGDQDNDNVMIRAVWWGYLNPSNIVALENPKRTDDEGMEMILGEDMTSEEANDKKKKRQERFGVQNDDDDDDNDAGLSAEEIELRNKRRERFAEDLDEEDAQPRNRVTVGELEANQDGEEGELWSDWYIDNKTGEELDSQLAQIAENEEMKYMEDLGVGEGVG